MITEIISAQITKKLLTLTNHIFLGKFLQPKTKFQLNMTFFHITIEASDIFFSPYSSRYVFLYGTHGESCQYGLCSLPICNPPQPQISHPTLLPYQGP